MQMLLESRVDRLEVARAEFYEVCRELKLEAAEIKREAAERELKYKEEKEERDRRQEERDRRQEERDRRQEENDRKDKEEKEERDRRQEENDRKDKEEKEERDRRQEESDRKYKEEVAEIKREAAENDRKYKEEVAEIKREAAERDRRQEERDRKDKEDHEAFRKEMAEIAKGARQQRAEIAKQLGTLVEDIIAPGAVALIKQYFNCDPASFCLRYKKRTGGKNCEVDIMLTCQDRVFVIEVKSKPDERDVTKILAKVETLPIFFDECKGRQIIPMLASVVVEDEITRFATIKGLYVVAYRQWEYLDILNFDEINTKQENSPPPYTPSAPLQNPLQGEG
ncbi:hypothetical protein [Candidatus Magnetobacterium casense]|uniref:hypothetical protein n=1 Tax=Candidatus Magnetobacterium casense TaxID=1455061 RepID=UPI00058B0FE9|nr:hypothetical protein [Candidatus Magnetobacterium casensis]